MNIAPRGFLPGSRGKSADELLPGGLVHELRQHFSRGRVEYIAHVLSEPEIRVIGDLRDALIIARIKRMPLVKLKRFDNYVPNDARQQKVYEQTQLVWIRDEEYLLGMRLGRSPSQKELFLDFMNNQNGLRFRAYYTMKYPKRMTCRPPTRPRTLPLVSTGREAG